MPVYSVARLLNISSIHPTHLVYFLLTLGALQEFVKDGRFDYLAFFSADPRFAAYWTGYEKRAATGKFDIYVRSGG